MILVTGGTGFLGSHLLFELTRSGNQVRALKRKESDLLNLRQIFSFYTDDPEKLLHNIEWVNGDLLDIFSLEEATTSVSQVYHCGAFVSFVPADKKKMLRVNIEGTANLVNASLRNKISKFCHVSSIAAIGRAEIKGLIDESTRWQASRRNSVYAISKYGAEREVWRGSEEGLDVVVVNPSVIIGPGDFHSGSPRLISLLWNGLKFYSHGVNGFVDVRDVARIMTRLMDDPVKNERFVLSSENLDYQSLFYYIAEFLDKPKPPFKVNPFIAEVAWRVEKLRSLLTGKEPAITRETARTSIQKYYYSNEKIRKHLDYEFIPVKESIRDACKLFLAESGKGKI